MRTPFFLLLLLGLPTMMAAQSNHRIGIGYFGHTLTHPGIVLEYEYEIHPHQALAMPLRIDAGWYFHQRNHTGLFLDASYGLRRYFKSGLILEESIGIGVLQSSVQGEAYQVDDSGNVTDASGLNPPQFMPSLSLGIGWNLTAGSDQFNYLWLRPKVFWRIPEKAFGVPQPAIQIGFTRAI